MLHANICESEKLSTISYPAETLYYRLLTRVDDNGNFSADPRIVFGQCMTLREDMNPKKVSTLLEELAAVSGNDKKPLIEFYEVDGDRWLHFTKFEDFQYLRPDRAATVRFPSHPNQMGPVVPNSMISKRFTSGLPMVNQTATNGMACAENGSQKIREEKLSKENNKEREEYEAGNWKFLAIKFRDKIGKFISSTKTNKQKYVEVCRQYGEDTVLGIFDEWAAQNKSWLSEKNDPLYYFWKDLPDSVAASVAEKEQKRKDGFVISESDVTAAMEADRAEKLKQIELDKEAARKQREFEEENRDQI